MVIGGDVVQGPMPRERLLLLLKLDLPIQFLAGNGELAVQAEAEGRDSGVAEPQRRGVQWNTGQLTTRELELLQTWPQTLRLRTPALGEILFCHATPHNPNDLITRLTPDAEMAAIFAEAGADVLVCGHTHMQFDRTLGDFRVVNAGSVGMPFGPPGACWLLLGDKIELRRTKYDLEAAAELIRQSAYPEAASFAASNVLTRPSEKQMLEAFGPRAPRPAG